MTTNPTHSAQTPPLSPPARATGPRALTLEILKYLARTYGADRCGAQPHANARWQH